MSKFQTKTSQYLVTLIVLALVVSFLFQQADPGARFSSPDDMGSVGPLRITQREYSMAYQSLLSRYAQLFGGQEPTRQQIEQFGLKQNALEQIVQQKLLVLFAREFSIAPDKKEIASAIKSTPYFVKDGQFRVDLYRNLLQQNGLTPAQFEEQFRQEIKAKKAFAPIQNIPISRNYLERFHQIKEGGLEMIKIQIDHQEVKAQIQISTDEINAFIADESSQQLIEDLYQQNMDRYYQPEQVLVSHILLQEQEDESEEQLLQRAKEIKSKLTKKNFAAQARKHSQDPGSQEKGGDLGWVQRGMMVPDFEQVAFDLPAGTISNPVQTEYGVHILYVQQKKAEQKKELASVQQELSKEYLQDRKSDQFQEKLKEISEKASEYIKANQISQLEKYLKSNNAQLEKNFTLSFLNNSAHELGLDRDEQIEELFSLEEGEFKKFTTNQNQTLIFSKQKRISPPQLDQEGFESLQRQLENTTQQQISQKIMEKLRDQYKVSLRRVQ